MRTHTFTVFSLSLPQKLNLFSTKRQKPSSSSSSPKDENSTNNDLPQWARFPFNICRKTLVLYLIPLSLSLSLLLFTFTLSVSLLLSLSHTHTVYLPFRYSLTTIPSSKWIKLFLTWIFFSLFLCLFLLHLRPNLCFMLNLVVYNAAISILWGNVLNFCDVQKGPMKQFLSKTPKHITIFIYLFMMKWSQSRGEI